MLCKFRQGNILKVISEAKKKTEKYWKLRLKFKEIEVPKVKQTPVNQSVIRPFHIDHT